MQTQRAFEAGLRGLRDSLTTRLDEVEAAQTGAISAYQSWAVAVGKTGAFDGAVMEVPPEDTGTHGQATSGGYDGTTVSNAGRYRWVAAWSRWLWISSASLAGKSDDFTSIDGGSF